MSTRPGNHDNSRRPASGNSAAGAVVALRLPGTTQALVRIRQMVVQAAESAGFSNEGVAQIEMATSEACSNIVEHAYRTLSQPPDLEVRITCHPDHMEVLILDFSSINFPVDQRVGLPLDDYIETQQRRGLGLFMIHSLVDVVEHRFVCGRGNELRLVKNLA